MLFYALVSAAAGSEEALEFFLLPEDAEALLREVVADEPELARVLRVSPVELGDEFILN